MNQLSKLLGLLGILAALFAFAGCSNLFNADDEEEEQQEVPDQTVVSALSGRWTVWDYPGPDWENHFTLIFDDTPTYSIEGRDGQVFETGPISNVTSTGFDYTIEQADHASNIIGDENHAEYTIDDDQLTITFYDDETKETAFGTLEAQRMELALIYQGIDNDGTYESWIQIYNDAFPIDIWYGDSTTTTTNDTAEYIWINLADDSQGIAVDAGTYTFPGGEINVLADATDIDIASDGATTDPDTYYDTRTASEPGPDFTRTQVISDATVTIGRDGDLYEISLSYTLANDETLEKYFKLPVAREYDKSGSINVRVYNESWSDPTEITADLEVEPIVEIDPAIGGQSLFVGNDLGYVEIDDVKNGDYTIHPVFTDGSKDLTLTVPKGVQVEDAITLPRDGIYYYAINTGSEVTQLNERDVRRALGIGIDRDELISAGGGGEPAAYNLMPPTLISDEVTGYDSLTESASEADTLLSDTSSFDFQLLHNENAQHADIAADFKNQAEAVSAIGTVTVVEKEWSAYRADISGENFDVARAGWILDSNNLLNYMEDLLGETSYSDATTTQLISEAQSALDDRDLTTHTNKVVELHNHLLDRMVIVPIFHYE